MLYLTFKSLHILAVILWLGSLCLVTYISAKSPLSNDQLRSTTKITEAAIGVTWLAGIFLVITGGWYTSTWWQLKIVLVVIISAIHTFVHRRWRGENTESTNIHGSVPVLIAVLTFAVILLVVFKRPM